jgi:hypothetical protein
MTGIKNIIQLETQAGPKITVGDASLTPQAQAVTLRWRGGGLVWNRPVALLIEQDNETRRIPIVDATRLAQISLLGSSVILTLILLILTRQQRRTENER